MGKCRQREPWLDGDSNEKRQTVMARTSDPPHTSLLSVYDAFQRYLKSHGAGGGGHRERVGANSERRQESCG